MWAVTSSMWVVTSYVYDVQALCGLLHPLTLTLIIIKVQCRARNPNPTKVGATRPKRRWVAATAVGLGFLGTDLQTGSKGREGRKGTNTGNQDREPRKGREPKWGTKTENGHLCFPYS